MWPSSPHTAQPPWAPAPFVINPQTYCVVPPVYAPPPPVMVPPGYTLMPEGYLVPESSQPDIVPTIAAFPLQYHGAAPAEIFPQPVYYNEDQMWNEDELVNPSLVEEGEESCVADKPFDPLVVEKHIKTLLGPSFSPGAGGGDAPFTDEEIAMSELEQGNMSSDRDDVVNEPGLNHDDTRRAAKQTTAKEKKQKNTKVKSRRAPVGRTPRLGKVDRRAEASYSNQTGSRRNPRSRQCVRHDSGADVLDIVQSPGAPVFRKPLPNKPSRRLRAAKQLSAERITSLESKMRRVLSENSQKATCIQKAHQTLQKLVDSIFLGSKTELVTPVNYDLGLPGESLVFSLTVDENKAEGSQIVQMLADTMHKAGIKVLKKVAKGDMVVEYLDKRKRDPVTCRVLVNNRIQAHYTKLLQQYMEIDERVLCVCRVVLNWSCKRTLASAFSSRALVTLVVGFLQLKSPAVLPCIQQLASESRGIKVHLVEGRDVSFCKDLGEIRAALRRTKPNEESVAALLCSFFHFFASEFHPEVDVVSVRRGKLLKKRDAECSGHQRGASSTYFCLEDPFVPEKNLTAHFSQEDTVALQRDCKIAYKDICNKGKQTSIFNEVATTKKLNWTPNPRSNPRRANTKKWHK